MYPSSHLQIECVVGSFSSALLDARLFGVYVSEKNIYDDCDTDSYMGHTLLLGIYALGMLD